MGLRRRVLSPLFAGLLLVPIVNSAGAQSSVFEGPVPRPAACAPGDRPETGIQGEVPIGDRQSGRSREGYNCNLELVGQYTRAEGFEGAAYKATYEDHCAYYETVFTGFTQAGFIDIYDVGQDCANPRLLSSRPFAGLSHEGNWTPDGNTFWASSVFPGILTAVDVKDPTNPLSVGSFSTNSIIHGLGISPDGNRLYVAYVNDDAYFTAVVNPRARPLEDAYGSQSKRDNNGLAIWDVSEFQARKPNPQAKLISTLFWKDGQVGQHVLPISRNGTPYVVFVDEYGRGGPRIIDISDERNPVIVSKLKTEIQMPENYDKFRDGRDYDQMVAGAVAGPTASSPPFAYNTHYCSVDRHDDPTILACSSFMSGVRIFDIRDFAAPKELAYYNPGGDGKLMPGSYGGHTSAYTTAAPRIIPETGEIWFTDMDGGFFVTRLAKGVWPLGR